MLTILFMCTTEKLNMFFNFFKKFVSGSHLDFCKICARMLLLQFC